MGNPRQIRRGFTLIELLVVMAIIVIVISIILPAMSHARRTARSAATKQLLSGFVQACAQFERDHNRTPGYFTPREMGDPENDARGFTTAQNVLLDLEGGIAPAGWSGTSYSVGPKGSLAVDVAPDLIGSEQGGSRHYFPGLDEKNFVAGVGLATSGDEDNIPSLVDAFGTPIMVWVVDEAASGPVESPDDFIRQNSSQGVARYYQAANAGLLKSTALGKLARDQASSSLLAQSGSVGTDSLMGLLGDPSFPTDLDQAPVLPTAPRSRILALSAGPDGVYMSQSDKGASWMQGGAKYVYNFYTKDPPAPANRHVNDNGTPVTLDVLDQFDDLFFTAGN